MSESVDVVAKKLGNAFADGLNAEFELPGRHLLAPTLRGQVVRRSGETHLCASMGPARAAGQLMAVWTAALSLYAVGAAFYIASHYTGADAERGYALVAGIWSGCLLFLHGGRQLLTRLEDREAARREFRRELWRTLGVIVDIPPSDGDD